MGDLQQPGHQDNTEHAGHRARGRGAVARLRLARRVVAALEPLDGARLDADMENPLLPVEATETPLLRTDLMIRALDLRVRIALLPGRSAESLDDTAVSNAAKMMLIENPETASVAVVADDPELTTRIIEPFDFPDIVATASPTSGLRLADVEMRSPVGDLLRRYLRQISPGWEPPARVQPQGLKLDEAARHAGADALATIQEQRKRTPEWRQAREGLGTAAAGWAARLALGVLQDGPADAEEALARYSRGVTS